MCRLLGYPGSIPLESFEDIRLAEKVSKKTLVRDLQGLERVSELDVQSYIRMGRRHWKLNNRELFKGTQYKPEKKTCTSCGELMFRDQFHDDGRRYDGLRSQCIECGKGERKAWRQGNPEQVRQKKRDWYQKNRLKINKERRGQYHNKKRIANS